jgi:hypothetical protein
MARCSRCGAARLGVARFCVACGGAIEEAQAEATAPAAARVEATATAPMTAQRSFEAGARVLVLWANGQQYPGTVQASAEGQCRIVFADGQVRWVATEHLAAGA